MSFDLGLLILRLVVGLLFVGHGSQKLFGWFGGHGMKRTAGWIGSLGLQPAGFWAFVGGLAEFGGGLLLALGLLNPIGPLAIIAVMVMAIGQVHWPKLWAMEGGFEYPLVNLAAVTAIALAGEGSFALDAALGTRLPMPATLLIGLAVVVAGYIYAVATAAPALAEAQPAPASAQPAGQEERRAA